MKLSDIDKTQSIAQSSVATVCSNGMSKQLRMRCIFEESLGMITNRELMDMNPDISETTIEDVLLE